jgi:hypothetical protein
MWFLTRFKGVYRMNKKMHFYIQYNLLQKSLTVWGVNFRDRMEKYSKNKDDLVNKT